jgi:hypothetical protein
MSNIRFLALAISTVAVVACNPFHRDPVTVVHQDVNMNTRWTGTLATPAALVGAVQMNGTAIMQPNRNGANTDFDINIANATPGGLHPWQAYSGACGSSSWSAGPATASGSIKVGDDGRGNGKATVSMVTPTTGNYFVVVKASQANSDVVVACGNLAAPTT